MPGIRDKLTRRYRRRWAIFMAGVAVVVVAALVCLYLVRHEELDKSPWQYLSVTIAILAAVFGLVMTVLEGKLENDLTGASERRRRARKLRHHRSPR